MKLIQILIFFIISISALAGEPSCKIIQYGIIGEMPSNQFHFKNPDAATGKTGKVTASVKDKMPFCCQTTKIPAKLGITFGVRHQFIDIPELGVIHSIITHPPMLSPSGEYKTTTSSTKSPTGIGDTYTFDTKEEVLSGVWTFSYYYNDKLLCQKKFTVYENNSL